MIPELQSSGDFDKYLDNNKYLVANFTAEWCGPCKTIKPILDSLYDDVNGKYAQVEIVRVDLDKFQDLAKKYQVTSVPSFLFFEKKLEVERVVGANVPKLTQKLEWLQNKGGGSRNGLKETQSKTPSSPLVKEIQQLIPSGFEVLNSGIDYSGYQVLNADGNIKDVFDLLKEQGISSDADSQLIVYVPLLNSCKIHSIYLKLGEDTQLPNIVKIWTNRNNIVSFDDVDSNVVHQEKIDGAPGWYHVKLKFVRFQNVTSLNLFFDGEDEDEKTGIDKIVLVGLSGEKLEQGTLVREE